MLPRCRRGTRKSDDCVAVHSAEREPPSSAKRISTPFNAKPRYNVSPAPLLFHRQYLLAAYARPPPATRFRIQLQIHPQADHRREQRDAMPSSNNAPAVFPGTTESLCEEPPNRCRETPAPRISSATPQHMATRPQSLSNRQPKLSRERQNPYRVRDPPPARF